MTIMKRKYKVVLGLLAAFGGKLSRKYMQKLVFLFCERNDSSLFTFIPFRYGCFSEELATLQESFIQDGYLKKNELWELSDKGRKQTVDIDLFDSEAIEKLTRRFGTLTESEIIKYVYQTHPYYAINSVILDKILSPEEQKPILLLKRKLKNEIDNKKIVSIGYEGYTIDDYIKMLLDNRVKVLCDVRKNPISRKKGFSKSALSFALEKLHITYYHFPELGIPSNMRQKLVSQEDYDNLFCFYEKNILSKNFSYIEEISSFLDKFGTVALLCFEKNPNQCHRTRIVNRILEYRENDVKAITSCQ